ncbi:hypothetical protein B6V74_14750 [Thioclava sp. F42-5]|uniref:IclR family transcriptional regulator n=1 Tax=Thioclava sp. F42-5 TaxID=1973005 RepID=UPI000B5432AF|nr:IclR family transcriptional regulator [Thioclava sp. F42-5]OWY08397.1 hypothetical protein B6V74_14750 [Thioclava sp. F42-5]
MSEKRSRQYVEAVEKAFAVLRAFKGHASLSLTELANLAGITKSAAQRFTYTLEQLGYLSRDESRRWVLTPRTLELGASYLSMNPLIERANPHLAELNRNCSESVNLSVPDGTDMVFVARFVANQRTFIHMALGTRIPMFCTASGRAYLSRLDTKQAEDLISGSKAMPYTAKTITDKQAVMEQIAVARHRGFAIAEEEYYVGDLAIAAPVFGSNGKVIGAINISGPTSRWTIEKLSSELSAQLIHTARAVSSGRPNA